jgi:WD40 repeat protein
LWEAETGNHIVILLVNDFFINGAMFNCDETKILTWGDDKTARIWEAGTGNPIGPLISADAPINGALFNRDETRILTWSDDKTVQLWEAGTGKPIGEPMTHDAPVNGAVFNRDETKILTWSEDGTIRFWDTDADYDFPLDLIKLQISTLTSTGFNSTTGEINIIGPWRWEEMKARYLEKAAKHYQSCKYKKANIFHRFYPHWPKK